MKTKQKRYSYIIDSVLPWYLNCDTPVTRRATRFLLTGQHKNLFQISVNPKGYSDWHDFAVDYQAVSLLRKFPGLDLGVDRRLVALEKFLESEKQCGLTSIRFYNLNRTAGDLYPFLERAKRIVSSVLGDFSWDSALAYCDHGPGSARGTPRRYGHRWYKISQQKGTVTGQCAALLNTLKVWDPQLHGGLNQVAEIVPGSSVTTVPKDARSDRCIAIEPLWNMFFQKGIGGLMRSRLRHVGVNLQDQSINQRLAQVGSVDGSLATIDLSSASDSVSMGLVDYLIPSDWRDAIGLTRSAYCELPGGNSHFLRKVSSMGNGFTFELESLIFYSLVKSCYPHSKTGRDVSVYGDDIIVPTQGVGLLLDLLKFCGFSTNVEKSFCEGPFRESCGKHYFRGHDVTPLYIRKDVASPIDLIALTNNVRRVAARHGVHVCDDRWRETYEILLNKVPKRLSRCSIPDNVGDGAIVRDFDECTPRVRRAGGWIEGFITKQFVRIPKTLRGNEHAALVIKLFDPGGTRELRGETYSKELDLLSPSNEFRYKVVPLLVTGTQWTTLGPWAKVA